MSLSVLFSEYENINCKDLSLRELKTLRAGLQQVRESEITSAEKGERFISLLRKFREALAENDKFHGANYPALLNSLLSVGEDGLYSNNLRFIFELIQNVDDCDFASVDDCSLDMKFDFDRDEIVLTYNEVGFSPFNVFAITGIAEAAKNISATKNEIGEKGIGFKSVFGVAERVLIRSGWFSFELRKENFTIPIAAYQDCAYCPGTRMTLFVPGKAKDIYNQIKNQYCRKEALFSKNPLLFLNKLTSLKIYYDSWRSMEFKVSRTKMPDDGQIHREDDVKISVNLHDYDNGKETDDNREITCTRYTCRVVYTQQACQSRYGENTPVGSNGGKPMLFQVVIPMPEDTQKAGKGCLYSFLPTQLAFTVPIVCHAPFKLDASREFVDPQNNNLWFQETVRHLASLLDYAFVDWAKTVKQDIVFYLPKQNETLFFSNNNNGKESCLVAEESFRGRHYLALPLFETLDGSYHPASEIFSFDADETIGMPVKAARLIHSSKAFFSAPDKVRVASFGITVEKDIYNRLFRRALAEPQCTNEIIEYLTDVKYKCEETQISENEDLQLSAVQIECLMKYECFAGLFFKAAQRAIKKHSRPKFHVQAEDKESIYDVLDRFDLSDTPKLVEQYMKYCQEICFCLDIPKGACLPCHNGIVLSKEDPLSSFAAFCRAIDQNDTFAISVALKEASDRLDQCIESNAGTAEDFIRSLKQIRRTIKASLGNTCYGSYVKLIMKSGTSATRYIQELLQNADDCIYPEGCTPSFTLNQCEGTMVAEYNEMGFTRANIRAITAIGESTKKSLLGKSSDTIGEKGAGFKSVFTMASEVRIYSGEYHFSLTADEPTIPKNLDSAKETVQGTRMELVLKEPSGMVPLGPDEILQYCLCLRQLKEISINGHSVSISDSDSERTITIDQQPHTFSRYVHSFIVTDEKALEERRNGSRFISPNQQIVCYVPQKSASDDYPLYTGLPTTHRINIPMVIDAPFDLTTSREEIDVGCRCWNDMIKKEMVDAVIEVIHKRKAEERIGVLRFVRIEFRLYGNQRNYTNSFSNFDYLCDPDFLDRLRSENILPTFDKTIFTSAKGARAYRYPEPAIALFDVLTPDEYKETAPDTIIDTRKSNERTDTVLRALSCPEAPAEKVFSLLQRYAYTYIQNESFRKKLYEYLEGVSNPARARDLKIIPVYSPGGGTQYISWTGNEIFIKKGNDTSDGKCWILNESILRKGDCEKIFGGHINELTEELKCLRYRENLRNRISSAPASVVYPYLISEFSTGKLLNNDCLEIFRGSGLPIPLKNELGEIVNHELFLCSQPRGYFNVEMLQRITVNAECTEFARYIGRPDLSGIYYEDVKDYGRQLTADDIEALSDDYFANKDEILRGFYRDQCIPDELLTEYDLEYLAFGRDDDSSSEYPFPEKPVRDRSQLIRHVYALVSHPVEILSKKVERSVQIGKKQNGETFELDGADARRQTLQIYTQEGDEGYAFCQMCHRRKRYQFMEVDNLEKNPKKYFPQTRVSLCLECSKRFKTYRDNRSIFEQYMTAIRKAPITSEGKIEIPIHDGLALTFTATHLAEIQEILKKLRG